MGSRRICELFLLGALGLSLALITACGAQHVHLNVVESTSDGPGVGGGSPVAVASEAEGIPDPIGLSTVTLFAIPSGQAHFRDGSVRVMEAVSKSLEAVGYRPVTKAERPVGPWLACEVSRMKFKTYTWFFPAIVVWSDIELSISLLDPAGKTIWAKGYADNRRSDESIQNALNAAFQRIRIQMEEDFASEAFKAACCEASSL